MQPELEAVGSSGKIFALQWLTMDRILVLGTAGLMTTWEMQTKHDNTDHTPGDVFLLFSFLYFSAHKMVNGMKNIYYYLIKICNSKKQKVHMSSWSSYILICVL